MAGLKTRTNMTGKFKDKQGKVATTDEEAAEIHAEYAESAFQPLHLISRFYLRVKQSYVASWTPLLKKRSPTFKKKPFLLFVYYVS